MNQSWSLMETVRDGWYGPPVAGLLLLATALLLTLLLRLLLRHLRSAAKKRSGAGWYGALLKAAEWPLILALWLLGLAFIAELFWPEAFGAVPQARLTAFRYLVVILLSAAFLFRFIRAVELNFIKAGSDVTTVNAAAMILRGSVIVLATVTVLQTLGISISGALAFGGMGGLVAGLAARDLLANFFGGLMLYLDQPFRVGDWIRSPDREIEGTVEQVGLRQTVIRTFDQRPLYVPNATFATVSVENPSRMHNRRIHETIGVRYEDAPRLPAIVDAVRDLLRSHPEIDTERTLIVNFDRLAPSSLDFLVYTFTRTTDWVKYHEVKQDVLLRILQLIADAGAEPAFPTSTLHLVHGEGDRTIGPGPTRGRPGTGSGHD